MCTYATNITPTMASVRGATDWVAADTLMVYVDHPYHLGAPHSVNVDFSDAQGTPLQRVQLELTPAAARQLAAELIAAVDSVDPGIFGPERQLQAR